METHRPIKPVSGGSGAAQSQPSLTPQRWQRIKELFNLALEREPGDRSAFLDVACQGDEALRWEIESLLRSSESDSAATSTIFKLVSESAPEPLTEAEDAMLGRRVDDYRIERRIGYGGMAAVYLASRADEQFQMKVAIKLLRPDLDRTELLRRFLNERQTLAALDHPNIVKLLDGGSTDEGLPYLVMDYVEGKPIDEYCDGHQVSIQRRLQLFCKVCEAVSYAHQHRVIHRDLKPNNILVTADAVPKLLDFGISKVLSPNNQAGAAITHTVNRRLTPAYASPEQVRGEQVASTTDVYSLGVILYELLTGHRPYRLKQRTPAAVEQAICEQEPESPSTVVDRIETETLPDGRIITVTPETVSRTREGEPAKLRHSLKGDLDNIVLKALHKDSRRRYSSVSELAEDIQRHLEHRPVLARPTTLLYRASKFFQRHKTEMIAAAAVVFVLVIAIGFSIWEESSASARARAELANQRSRGRRSVAVLGFKNLSARSDTAWLSTALSEMLTTELSLGGKLRTISGENVAQTKMNLSIPETESLSAQTLNRLYKNLGSDFVVLGSYLDEGGSDKSIRLDLQVQDAALGETVASIVETGYESSLPGLVTHAGSALRAKLQVAEISTAEAARAQAALPSNPTAVRFYAEGLDRLRLFDALGAREKFEQAIAADPAFVMAHSALAEAWAILGYDSRASDEARKAFDLSSSLPREESLLTEARYRQTSKDWSKAAALYETLFNFFPDNVDYGLQLAACRTSAGKANEAFATLESLRRLPPPSGSDPRIDLSEASAAAVTEDYRRLAHAAESAALKGSGLGSQLVVAQARLYQASAWRSLGDPKRANATLDEARRLFLTCGDRSGEAKSLRDLGAIFVDQGDFLDAKTNLEEALGIVRQIGNRAVETDLLGLLAQMHYRQGDMNSAKQMTEQYIVSAREIGNMADEGDALNKMGKIESNQSQFSLAETHIQEALTIARAIGNKSQVVRILNNLGSMYMKKGKDKLAKKTLEESVATSRQTGNKDDTGAAILNLADATGNLGDLSRAEQLYNQSLQIFRDTGNQSAQSYALYALSDIKMLQDDLRSAVEGYNESLAIAERIGAKSEAANTRVSLARIAMQQGRLADAEQLARDAAEEFRKEKIPTHEVNADTILANSLRAQRKLNEAESVITEGKKGIAADDITSLASLDLIEAQIRVDQGNPSAAIALLNNVIQQARKAGLPDFEFQARLDRADISVKSGNRKQGVAELSLLERDAKARGFLIFARSAAETRKQLSASVSKTTH